MKIIITGANGLLGQHLAYHLSADGEQVIATGKGPCRLPPDVQKVLTYVEMDFTNDAQVQAVFAREKPDIVIHAGAMTQVDECEQNQEACFTTNVEGTANLLVAAEEHAKFFLYVSTDFVFDGDQGNYSEGDHLNPVSWYGFTKVQAESTVETSEIPWAIVRTCLVYGNLVTGTRSNIITWVKQNLEEGKPIKVVSDQVRTPTYVYDLVKGIRLILKKQATGIFHISGKDRLTPYDMALLTADFFNLDKSLITQVDASTFSQPARRPLKTGFDLSRANQVLGYEPARFEENLRVMFGERL